MSTRMDEEDWAYTLVVFQACLPRRGRKANDDRRFLEALHFFKIENVRWRALPERFGHWNSVWKRFDRLRARPAFSKPSSTRSLPLGGNRSAALGVAKKGRGRRKDATKTGRDVFTSRLRQALACRLRCRYHE